ncbi:MAG: DUF748 domain-containing protein, partial [Desulfobulbaceae bacterium]|nr:DUF748 domain-containing protein [Desulfobulbaceae bacterium]
ISINRNKSGDINLSQLFTPRVSAPPAQHIESPSWKISSPAVAINDIDFTLEDLSTEVPVSYKVSDIDVSSEVTINTGAKTDILAKELSLELTDSRLGILENKEPLFETKHFLLQGGEVDFGAHTLVIPSIKVRDGHLDINRDHDGTLSLRKIFTAQNTKATAHDEKKGAASSAPPWKYGVKKFDLRDFGSTITDQKATSHEPLVQVKDLALQAGDIDDSSPMDVVLSFALKSGGKVTLNGKVNPTVPSVDAKIKVSKLLLHPLQPYLEPYITLTLQSASVSTEGALRYGIPKDVSEISYDGDFILDTLRLSEANSKETYLGWDALQIPKLKLNLSPNNFQAKEIRLKKPLGQLIIAEDQSVNLAKIIKKQPPEKSGKTQKKEQGKKPKDNASTFPFTIGKVVVEDGKVAFADLSLTPKFTTRIHHLKGVASSLSSSKDSLSEIQLDGGVDQYGYVKVSGVLNLSDIKRSADINMTFNNVELTNVTPYSGKFAGRYIKSGKLFMDLNYKIQDNKMRGDNKIILENLALGEHVDSPEAVNLPLDLAIALLKDTSGKIDIGLPVSGDLNDPQFSLGPLIWKAFSGLIVKAVTSPFRALGSLFGNAKEKFDAVSFEAGRAELLPPEKEKLKKLVDVLQKRPQLRLVLQGQYSPGTDGDEFKQNSLRRATAILTGEKIADGEVPAPLDLADNDTRRALEKIYAERFGAPALKELNQAILQGTIKARPANKPKLSEKKAGDQNGFMKVFQAAKLYRLIPGAKSPEQSALMTEEIYARLFESEPVSKQDLLQLAEKRVKTVSAELENGYGLPSNRITTIDPVEKTNKEGLSVKLSLDAMAVPQ